MFNVSVFSAINEVAIVDEDRAFASAACAQRHIAPLGRRDFSIAGEPFRFHVSRAMQKNFKERRFPNRPKT
jgi:hypothetical protein